MEGDSEYWAGAKLCEINRIIDKSFQGVLTQVTQSTKQTLNRLGVFTVSSFHAYICARSPSLLNNLLAGRGATKRRAPALSRSNSGTAPQNGQAASGAPTRRGQVNGGAAASAAAAVGASATGSGGSGGSGSTILSPGDADKLVKVTLPDNQVIN